MHKRLIHIVLRVQCVLFLTTCYVSTATSQSISAVRYEDSAKAVRYLQLAKNYHELPGRFPYDGDSTIYYATKANSIASQLGDNWLYSQSCIYIAYGYAKKDHLSYIASFANTLNDSNKTVALLIGGRAFTDRIRATKKDLDSGVLYLQEGIAIARQLRNDSLYQSGLTLLVSNYIAARHTSAVHKLLPALKPRESASQLYRLALQYKTDRQEDSSRLYFQKAIQSFSVLKDEENIILCQKQLAELQVSADSTDKTLAGLQDEARFAKLLILGRSFQSGYPAFDMTKLRRSLAYLAEAERSAVTVCGDSCLQLVRSALGHTYFLMGDNVTAMRYFQQIIDTYTSQDKLKKITNTWIDIARYIPRKPGNFRLIIDAYEQVAQWGIRIKDVWVETTGAMEQASMLILSGSSEEGEKILLGLTKKYKDEEIRYASTLYRYLSDLQRTRGDLYKALYYAMHALEQVRSSNPRTDMIVLSEKIANIYADLGQPVKSIEWYQQSIDLNHDNVTGIGNQLMESAIALQMIKLNRTREALEMLLQSMKHTPPQGYYQKVAVYHALGNCYNALGDYTQAEKYFLSNVTTLWYMNVIAHVYMEQQNAMGSFYLQQKNYVKAAYHLNMAVSRKADLKTAVLVKDAHLMLFRCDSAMGNYTSSIRHYQQYLAYNDSMFSIATSRKLQELQIKYDTELKDASLVLKKKDLLLQNREILLLTRTKKLQFHALEQAALIRRQIEEEALTKDRNIRSKELNIRFLSGQRRLQQVRLEQESLIRKLSFGGGLLLLVICGMLINRYRYKQRSNQQLESQQKEIHHQNLSLEKLVLEKEWLLKEIHHRVKNNLQIVMSLLNSQSVYLQNESALLAIRDSQHRVQAISLIHKKLYQTADLMVIYLPHYIHELIEYLQDSLDPRRQITFNLQISSLRLDMSQAVPLCLIINEAITNSLKYAFTTRAYGCICITLEELHSQRIALLISDNGTGRPADERLAEGKQLGINLIRGLSEDLGGTFTIQQDKGTIIRLVFGDGQKEQRPHHSSIQSQYI